VCHVAAPEWAKSAACATWHTFIGPPQHMWAPHQWSQPGSGPHQYATWQLVIRPPQQAIPHGNTLGNTRQQIVPHSQTHLTCVTA
jgi:hypothetical protein